MTCTAQQVTRRPILRGRARCPLKSSDAHEQCARAMRTSNAHEQCARLMRTTNAHCLTGKGLRAPRAMTPQIEQCA